MIILEGNLLIVQLNKFYNTCCYTKNYLGISILDSEFMINDLFDEFTIGIRPYKFIRFLNDEIWNNENMTYLIENNTYYLTKI